MAKQDDYIKTALRLPADLHARIQLAAEKAGRSMNAEILDRLFYAYNNESELHRERSLAMLEALRNVVQKAFSGLSEEEMADAMVEVLSRHASKRRALKKPMA